MEHQLLTTAETDPAVMIRCVDGCERCHRVCLRIAMTCGLEPADEHFASSHLRLLLACSDLCRATADALLGSFDTCEDLCALCARVCDQCAESCEHIEDLHECAAACRSCAQSCLAVTGG